MAVVIVSTVGSASANSYVTLAEAQTYMDTRLNGSLWTAASADSTNRALVEATRELQMQPWQGYRVDTTQALQWPRNWVCDPDTPNFAWAYFASTVIPQRVKDACCELAFQFVNAGTTDVAALDPNIGVIEKTVDVLTTRWQPYQKPSQGLGRFPRVMGLIRPLLTTTANMTTLVRG